MGRERSAAGSTQARKEEVALEDRPLADQLATALPRRQEDGDPEYEPGDRHEEEEERSCDPDEEAFEDDAAVQEARVAHAVVCVLACQSV